MFDSIHKNKRIQLVIGLLIGIMFGFLLQKGGVTKYNVIIGQLLFTNYTVLKVMLTAVITGMTGVYLLHSAGKVKLHPKTGSVGSTIPGGLIFGAGFAILGYCPGTLMGAAGEGALDALVGGIIGMLIGASLFAALYPKLEKTILKKGYFGDITFPRLFNINPWVIVIPLAAGLIGLLIALEKAGV